MSWRNHLEKIKAEKDARLAWRTVRGFKNNEQQPTGKALQYRSRLYHRDQAKANAFIQEYTSTSSRTSDRVSRLAVKQHRQDMQSLLRCPRRTPEQAFHQDELQSALKQIKVSKAAGPDEIAPDLLKHLPTDVEVELLNILNHVWLKGWCSQSWQDEVIIPFFKKDKDPQSVDSYRPIALTSTICKLFERMTNILRTLGGTTWGWRPVDLRTIYIATQRSLAKYGSQAWASWLSKSNLGKLESAQLNAARAITGHLRSTPGEFVLKEAHLTPLEARYKTLSLPEADSWLQLADTDPRRLTFDRQAPQRLVKKDWRGLTTPILSELNLFSQHQTGEARLPPPWDRLPPAPSYMTPANKSMPQNVQHEKAQRTIEEVGHSDLQIHTDGSTTDGTRNGGVGMIIARDKKVLHNWHAHTGVRSSSYSAEKAALEAALKWLGSDHDWHGAVIVCDCKSLVEATGNPHQADPIIVTLQRSIAKIICFK